MKILGMKEDGSVIIIHGVPKERIEEVVGPITYEEYKRRLVLSATKNGAVKVRQVEDEDIPSDRTFRDAWVDVSEDSKVDISVAKAKEIATEEIRRRRNKELEKLDKELMVAIELGKDNIEEIREAKQVLRDATESIKNFSVNKDINDDEALEYFKSEVRIYKE